ncbi:CAP domain-containing protein [Nocardioides sp. GY 10127]|uniref:CAP domain-containing protein n=1 Tax=Nocardioides sp. GY 10127 TaxID=2569762 RepID=UPI001458FFE8|nr:CAP domain-containing protein [Nocardioides sp. GY 10127]
MQEADARSGASRGPRTVRVAAPLLLAALLGALLVGVPLLGSGPAGGDAVRAPRVEPVAGPAQRTAQETATPRSAGAIDTTDRSAVAIAYRRRFAPALTTRLGWTGSVDGCVAGRVRRAAHAATLDSINFARALAGLDPVSLAPALTRDAQKAALIMAAQGALSHDPPRSWRCWTKAGAAAAGRSNLALTSGSMTPGLATELYLGDEGSSNTAVGHRRWLLYPYAHRFGDGLTSTSSALTVLGSTDPDASAPAFVPWPSAGWFPAPLEPSGRWSLSSTADADFSSAHVRVLRNGTRLRTTTYAQQDGYGLDTLVMEVHGVRPTGRYRVTVRGIAGEGPSRFTWTVRLMDPSARG